MLFAIPGFALSVVLIAGTGFALPRASSVERAPAVELVGFGCNFVNGKLVCGKSESGDNDGDDSGDHPKKKAKDGDSELTECTIQQGPGGGGCTTGFKHVCEKLKSGKKCCGCVADKNAQAPAPAPAEAPKPDQFCCTVMEGNVVGPQMCEPTLAEAQRAATYVAGETSFSCFAECIIDGRHVHCP